MRLSEQRRYKYRNIGVRIVYEELDPYYEGYRGRRFHITKNNMRHYGITYSNTPVVIYEGTYIVMQKIFEIIKKEESLKEIYEKYIRQDTYHDFMDFQQVWLDRYIASGQLLKPRYYSEKIREPLIELIKNEE